MACGILKGIQPGKRLTWNKGSQSTVFHWHVFAVIQCLSYKNGLPVPTNQIFWYLKCMLFIVLVREPLVGLVVCKWIHLNWPPPEFRCLIALEVGSLSLLCSLHVKKSSTQVTFPVAANMLLGFTSAEMLVRNANTWSSSHSQSYSW